MGQDIAKKDTSETNSLRGFDLDAGVYASISMAARLDGIRLVEAEYKITPEVFAALENFDKMGHSFHGATSEFRFDEDGGTALGRYKWEAEIKSGRKKVLKLVASYFVMYTNLEGCDEDHVKHFYDKVVRFATYPYFRALFSRQCAESGIMLPPLPTLNERID